MSTIGIVSLCIVGILLLVAGFIVGKVASFERITDLEEYNKSFFDTVVNQRGKIQKLKEELNTTKKKLDEGQKRWAYFESRFVECNTCDNEMKEKCIMFSENLCEGERCKTLIDLEALLDKACDKEIKEIE